MDNFLNLCKLIYPDIGSLRHIKGIFADSCEKQDFGQENVILY